MDVRDYGVSIRSRAIGQLESGITQKVVSKSLSVSLRSVRRWWHAYKSGKSLESTPKSGRKKTVLKYPDFPKNERKSYKIRSENN